MVKPSQENEFFVRLGNIFFEILTPFHISKHFRKYQTLFSKKIRHESTTLTLIFSPNRYDKQAKLLEELKTVKQRIQEKLNECEQFHKQHKVITLNNIQYTH